MYSKDFKEMTWEEFSSLLSGLGADTPLGNIVQIRSETDPKILKNFNSAQKRIWNEWQNKNYKQKSQEDFLREIQKMFAQ
jgi:hypothetical protein